MSPTKCFYFYVFKRLASNEKPKISFANFCIALGPLFAINILAYWFHKEPFCNNDPERMSRRETHTKSGESFLVLVVWSELAFTNCIIPTSSGRCITLKVKHFLRYQNISVHILSLNFVLSTAGLNVEFLIISLALY